MWKLSSVLLLLLLLLSVPIFSDVVLTEKEWEELNLIWTELETLTEEQAVELESVETQLNEALSEISVSENYLKKAELSWIKRERELKTKTIIWVVGSFIAGAVAGIILE